MTELEPEDQLKQALAAVRRQERTERDESVADELAQTDRLIGSIDATTDDGNHDSDSDSDGADRAEIEPS